MMKTRKKKRTTSRRMTTRKKKKTTIRRKKRKRTKSSRPALGVHRIGRTRHLICPNRLFFDRQNTNPCAPTFFPVHRWQLWFFPLQRLSAPRNPLRGRRHRCPRHPRNLPQNKKLRQAAANTPTIFWSAERCSPRKDWHCPELNFAFAALQKRNSGGKRWQIPAEISRCASRWVPTMK